MTAEEYLENEFPHLNNDIVSEKFNKDVFISCVEQYAKQEKKALLRKLIDQNAATNRSMLVEVVEELKTLNNE